MGCETVTEFLGMFPIESYVKVAERLGGVAAIQLMWIQFDEAQAAGRVRDAARDHLSRRLAWRMRRKGWGLGIHWDRIRVGAFVNWAVAVKGHFPGEFEEQTEAVLEALEASAPPSGWRPESSEDPLLVAAFDKGWPR